MIKVRFKFDKERDLYNIWETCNKSSSWHDHKKNVSPDLLKICENKKFSKCKKSIKERRENMHNSGFIEIFAKSVQESWDKINEEYFKRLEKIMGKPICSKEFIGYVTTMGRCPYDYNKKNPWFMISFFRPLLNVLCTTGHEIMHIQFHNTYWKDVEKEIGYDKTNNLKEALTVLLNLEFGDLWFVFDVGYEPHKELREFITEKWKEEKDFEKLLEKCVHYLKSASYSSAKLPKESK